MIKGLGRMLIKMRECNLLPINYHEGTKQNVVRDGGNHVLLSIVYEQGTKQIIVKDEEIITYCL